MSQTGWKFGDHSGRKFRRRNSALAGSHRISSGFSRLEVRRRFGGLRSPISVARLTLRGVVFCYCARKKPEPGSRSKKAMEKLARNPRRSPFLIPETSLCRGWSSLIATSWTRYNENSSCIIDTEERFNDRSCTRIFVIIATIANSRFAMEATERSREKGRLMTVEIFNFVVNGRLRYLHGLQYLVRWLVTRNMRSR